MGGTEVGALYYDLNIDDKGLKQQLDSADRKIKGFGNNAEQNFGKAEGGFKSFISTASSFAAGLGIYNLASTGIQKLTNYVGGSVSAFQESKAVAAQTQAVLKSTGGVAGVTADEVEKMALSLQKASTFTDEQITSGENMLLTFTNIGKKVFPDATQAVTDMATAMHQDMQSTAIQAGKALQNPVEGVTALQRVGVRLSDSQKKQVEDFMKVNDVASAQKVILKELQTEFGGSAAAADAAAGPIDDIKDTMGNLQEVIGGKLMTAFQTIIQWFKEAGQVLWQFLGPSLKDLWNTISTQLWPAIQELWKALNPALMDALKIVGIIVGGVLIGALWAAINIIKIIVGVVTEWVHIMSVIYDAVGTAIGAIINWFKKLPDSASNAIGNVIDFFRNLPRRILEAAGDLGNLLYNAGKNLIQSLINGIKDKFNDVKNVLGDLTKKITSWKGPESVDKKLLTPNARLIMQGFVGGLESQYGIVRQSLAGLTGSLGAAVLSPSYNVNSAPMTGSGATHNNSTVYIGNVYDKSDAEYIIRRTDTNTRFENMGLSPV